MTDDKLSAVSSQLAPPPASILPEEAELVELIRQYGPLSRTDLARKTGYSRAKITPLASRLVSLGILQEVGAGESQGGRRPRLLHFNSLQGCVIGVDIGATSLDVALAALTGQVVDRAAVPIDVQAGPDSVLAKIHELAGSLLDRNGISAGQVYTIGIGVPGPVQFSTGLLVAPPLMPGWHHYPIRQAVGALFPHARVVVDNDVNIMALGEQRVGAGVGVENLIFVKIGTGIGAGIICHGAVYRGSNGCAGDIGHICADPHGPVCRCGNIGCLEAIAAGPAIAARALEAARSGASELLANRLSARGTLTAADVSAAAGAGDRSATEIILQSGQVIGSVLAMLVNFFNPDLLLIGGGVSQVGFQLLASIRQRVFQRSTPLATHDLRIEFASLGLDGGVMGAVALALEHAFVVEQV